MLEFLICSLVTILPDYLFRAYVQGKRWGAELTFFSIWYELRWGLTACALLTVAVITMIFYYHPTTTAAGSFFRTVTLLSERAGRVAEVYVASDEMVKAGDPIFRLDDSQERSTIETLKRRIAELDAALVVGQAQLAAAEGQISQAQGSLKQAEDELARTEALRARNPNVVAEREIDRLKNTVDSRQGALDAAEASRDAVRAELETQLPAQKASAAAQLDEAEVALSKTLVSAGTDGRIEQFDLKPGDVINPILRPAGILVPATERERRFQAGFGQIAAQVLKVGMIAEMTCFSKPFTVVPMIVVQIQDVIAAGQFRPTDLLRDVAAPAAPGTVRVVLEPLYAGGADDIPPGSRCIANAYTSFHHELESGEVGGLKAVFYHAVEATGVVHAAILRIQALLFPIRTLVFAGH